MLDALACSRDGVAHAAARVGREDIDAGLPADDLQLGDGVGPLQVAGHQQRGVALGLEPHGELAGQRGLPGALQARQHDDGRPGLGVADQPGLPAEDGDKLLVDDLDDLLRRVQRPADLGATGSLLDSGDEGLDDGQRDVCLEQGDADLAGRGVDVGLGQLALAAQGGEDLVEPVGKGVGPRPSGAVR